MLSNIWREPGLWRLCYSKNLLKIHCPCSCRWGIALVCLCCGVCSQVCSSQTKTGWWKANVVFLVRYHFPGVIYITGKICRSPKAAVLFLEPICYWTRCILLVLMEETRWHQDMAFGHEQYVCVERWKSWSVILRQKGQRPWHFLEYLRSRY